MYNLVVSGNRLDGNSFDFPFERLFEYTDDSISAKFKDGNQAIFDKLIMLPCLFMQEGIDDELAFAGTITRARKSGKIISIEYAIDKSIPPILNRTIYNKKTSFDIIHDFEFSRNHWAIKNIDLYRMLLQNFKPQRQKPTVFKIEDHEKIEPSLASVMMPFSAAFQPVYKNLQEAAVKVGLLCRRADEIWENPAIIQDIVSLIDRSRVVICDCTGRNPNVFYEIGIAHTLGRDVILITQNEADIPFDLRHLRYIHYLNNSEGLAVLSTKLEEKLCSLIRSD